MNVFSDWHLAPRLKVELRSLDKFEKSIEQGNAISVLFTTRDDLEKEKSLYASALLTYGELKKKTLYQDFQSKVFIYIVPDNEPRGISLYPIGKAHKASYFGALLTSQLYAFPLDQNRNQNICITLSNEIKAALEGEQSEFILGLLQRSVSNNLKKNKIAKANFEKTIIFSDDFIKKDDLAKAISVSDAMCYTRTLINMPANILNPESYEQYAKTVLEQEFSSSLKENSLQIETLNMEQLTKLGCGLITAVGKGSTDSPRILKFVYAPKNLEKNVKSIALVGKGITFDSGGYDIKPPSGMRIMKKDMGGSAAAFGVFVACVKLKLPVKISCYLAVAENMISGNAMRPGDVYSARNGMQVEIDNTDAEGRLVLADAICLACEEKPDWLIDIATLTGAARVSLGAAIDSLFGNHEETTALLQKTGLETGDWVWSMPLPLDYESYFDSAIADFMNSGASGFAGSITAALFLQKFVSVTKWNHIDSYMWCDKSHGLWNDGNGPTGKCIRLLTRAIERFLGEFKDEEPRGNRQYGKSKPA